MTGLRQGCSHAASWLASTMVVHATGGLTRRPQSAPPLPTRMAWVSFRSIFRSMESLESGCAAPSHSSHDHEVLHFVMQECYSRNTRIFVSFSLASSSGERYFFHEIARSQWIRWIEEFCSCCSMMPPADRRNRRGGEPFRHAVLEADPAHQEGRAHPRAGCALRYQEAGRRGRRLRHGARGWSSSRRPCSRFPKSSRSIE